ncbi:MAG: hypothetical protein HWE14_14320 [Flavobacteriia bacterium]|nr:hypothetical protein [Flavobacteriia bacterium]
MKTTTLTLLLFLTIGFTANAQYKETQFGAFVAQPVGAFGSTDYANDGGYAETGWGIIVDDMSRPEGWGNFGYLFHSTYQWNTINTEQLAADYTEAIGSEFTATESRYSPLLTTIGPTYDLELASDLTLGFAAGAGILFNNTRDITLDQYDSFGNHVESYHIAFDNNVSFAYYGQINLRYTLLRDQVRIALFADYTGSSQSTEVRLNGDAIDSKQDITYITYGLKLILIGKN